MKRAFATLAVLAVMGLTAGGCMSHKMMMSDRSMMSSDGTMMMMNSDGTSRMMTDQEMHDHMSMMMNDSRYSSMMMDHCKSMGSSSSMPASSMSSSNMSGGMMVMNSDGTSRPMTDAEFRSHMNMMMKNAQTSKMMMSKCSGM